MSRQTCWCGGSVQRVLEDGVSRFVCTDSKFHDPMATGQPNRVNRLYLAGPMTGYPECNYPAFDEAERLLSHAGYLVGNPASVHVERCHYTDLIREDLRILLDCNGVAVLDRWWESVGARNEVNNAGILKMPVRTVSEWLERAYVEVGRPA